MESWQKILAVTAGAAGVAGVLCYLLKDDEEADESTSASATATAPASAGAAAPGTMTKEGFIELLKEIVDTKTKSGDKLKEVSKNVMAAEASGSGPLGFEKLYALVQESNLDTTDPMEKRGLSPEVIDEGIQKWGQNDLEIQGLLESIMTPPSTSSAPPKDISLDTLAELHTFMANEAEAFIKLYEALGDKSKYDGKAVMMVFQVSLDVKVLQKFDVESQDVQNSIMSKQSQLMTNPKFMEAFQTFQMRMQKLIHMLPGLAPGGP